MRLGGKDVTLYRYQPDADEPADYFDAKGQSAKGMLMKTPVDGARISSGFGSRCIPFWAIPACTRAWISPCPPARR